MARNPFALRGPEGSFAQTRAWVQDSSRDGGSSAEPLLTERRPQALDEPRPLRVLTLDQARRKARKFLAQADEGIDPIKEKRRRNRELRRAHTVADLCDAFLERHARIKKTWREI